MKRISIIPRYNWKEKVEQHGMLFHTINDQVYWDESCYYEFTELQIDTIEDATNELHQMCLKAVENIIQTKDYANFCIPENFINYIEKSWKEDKDKSIYGRFDFSYCGIGNPKLLEYNADTPTALLEASVIQWFWLNAVFPEADQFNSIDEKLLDLFAKYKSVKKFHFSSMDSDEDYMTVLYLIDVAQRSGVNCEFIDIKDIGFNSETNKFVDMQEEVIENLFKLYPWEMMSKDKFGEHIINSGTNIFEPSWKMLLSNKALLVKLYEMYPGHKNLLPASYSPLSGDYVKKPINSREGANITIVKNSREVEKSDGVYGNGKFIYQLLYELPDFVGNYPVIGSWIVGNTACGMGIREDTSLITKNTSRFVPHLFR